GILWGLRGTKALRRGDKAGVEAAQDGLDGALKAEAATAERAKQASREAKLAEAQARQGGKPAKSVDTKAEAAEAKPRDATAVGEATAAVHKSFSDYTVSPAAAMDPSGFTELSASLRNLPDDLQRGYHGHGTSAQGALDILSKGIDSKKEWFTGDLK